MESELYDNTEEGEEEEDLAELEAMLYSQIYYQQDSDNVENSDFIINNCLTVTECPEKTRGLETPGADSGCGLSGPGSHINSDAEEEEEEDISKYSISSNKIIELVENPFFDSECSSDTDSEDDGIIVVPKTPAKPIEIIEMDTSSNQSGSIIISDHGNDEIQIVEELRTINRKNNKKNIKDALPKRFESNKLELGSDFSDNFLSSNESDGEGNKLSDADLTLNLSASGRKRERKTLKERVGLHAGKYMSKSATTTSDLPSNWTRDMRKFYSEVDETYLELDLQQVLARLPTGRECWRIDRADLYGLTGLGGRRQSRYWTGRKCNNCQQSGHLASHCPEPPRPVRCHMCGQTGHRETRCPDRSCLWCGQPGFDFLQSCLHCRKLRHTACRTCGYTGHVARDCPDTWRRYHATTSQGEITDPGNSDKPEKDCWCCNCGRRGHLVTDCHSYRSFKYPNTSLRVISYKPDAWLMDNNPPQTEAAGTDKKKKKNKKKSQSCPSTPKTKEVSFQSEPSSPAHSQVFPTTLLVEKAISKLDKRKNSKETKKKRMKQEKLNHEIIRHLNNGKSKKQILAEILSSNVQEEDEEFLSQNKHLKSKQIKTAISTCMSQKRAETRQKEFKLERGFGKMKPTEKLFPRNEETQSRQSRANLIPTDSKAAVKFLKKEVQKQSGTKTSGQARRLSKELNQEIFGLKNLHSAGLLKKVERKRLADIVLQLREAT